MLTNKKRIMRNIGIGLLVLTMIPAGAGFAAGKAKKGYLGVNLQELTPSLKDELKLGTRTGLLVTVVVPGSPADKAGLEPKDVILKFNGKPVERLKAFTRMVHEAGAGTEVRLIIFRKGKEKTLTVELGKAKRGRRHMMFSGNGNNLMLDFRRPWLGVRVLDLDEKELAAYFSVEEKSGVLVISVEKDSPAQEAGLKPGDVITRFADEKITDRDDLIEVLSEHEAGEKVTVDIVRHGKKKRLEIELEESETMPFRLFSRSHNTKFRLDDEGENFFEMPEIPTNDAVFNFPEVINYGGNKKIIRLKKGDSRSGRAKIIARSMRSDDSVL